jgi:hypothetical protein
VRDFEQVLAQERVLPTAQELHVDERIFFLEGGLQRFGVRSVGRDVNHHLAFLLRLLDELCPIRGLALGVDDSGQGKDPVKGECQ